MHLESFIHTSEDIRLWLLQDPPLLVPTGTTYVF